MQSKEIRIFDRKTRQVVREKVLGDMVMRCFYGNSVGVRFTTHLLTNSLVSKLYGSYNDSSMSRKKIPKFVSAFGINVEECEKKLSEYRSFNDFFSRKLKPNARPIDNSPNTLISPADGRIIVFPKVEQATITQVKWAPIRLMEIFGNNSQLADKFDGGSCAIIRLCPTDYHRFHFPVSGRAGPTKFIDGLLHSVNPYALDNGIPVFCLNKRTLCLVESNHFGEMAFMEIGALMVGSIVQTYKEGADVVRGSEKGYFEFGGSTCILFFQKGKVAFDFDLIEQSRRNTETLVRMGERIGASSLS